MSEAPAQAMTLTPCGKLASATFPQVLENPQGFPQTHSLYDEILLLFPNSTGPLTVYRGTPEDRADSQRAAERRGILRVRVSWWPPLPLSSVAVICRCRCP